MSFVPFMTMIGNHDSPDILMRIRNLETALTASMNVIQSLVQKLEAKLGPGFLGDDFIGFADLSRDSADQLAQIDQLIKEGKQPAAARLVREMAGITWDQAHYATQHWLAMSREKKIRWLQFTQWSQRVLQQANTETHRDRTEE